MKDITGQRLQKVYESEMNGKICLVVDGEKCNIPDHVMSYLYKNWAVYEAKNIADIKQNYSIRKNKVRIPFKMIKFCASLALRSLSRLDHRTYSELRKKYGTTRKFLVSNSSNQLKFLLTRKVPAPISVVISDVRLEDFKTYRNELFTIHTFVIVDMQGEKISCVYDEYHYLTKNIQNPTRPGVDIDTIKNGEKSATWVVTASLLDENVTHQTSRKKRGMCLGIINIQTGGRKNPPDMPVLTV